MMPLTIWIPGKAEPQGSKSIGGRKGGKPHLYDANAVRLKPWRETVTLLARNAITRHPHWLPKQDTPMVVSLWFYFVRPPSVKREQRPHMTVKPDLDKLTRAALDSLTVAKVYGDDARVVEIHVYKLYADNGDQPGLRITVEERGGPE